MTRRLEDVDDSLGWDWYATQQIISVLKGYTNQGVPVFLDQANEPDYYALRLRNQDGTTGHLLVADSANATILEIIDPVLAGSIATTPASNFYGGVAITNGLGVADGIAFSGGLSGTGGATIAGGLTVSTGGLIVSSGGMAISGNSSIAGTLGVTGLLTASSGVSTTTVTASGDGSFDQVSTTNTGAAGISIATGNGIAPMTITSQTQVTNLNAQFTGGRSPGTGVGNLAFYDASGRVADSQLLDGLEGSAYALAHSHPYAPSSHTGATNADHDARYAPFAHTSGANSDHDGRYAPFNHTSSINADHDARYALVHSHPYAASSHTSSGDHDGRYILDGGDTASGSYTWNGAHDFNSAVTVDGLSVVNGGSLAVNTSVFKADDTNVGIGTSSPNNAYVLDINGATLLTGTLRIESGVINFDFGSVLDYSTDTWNGWIQIQHDGVTRYVPFKTIAPV